MLPFHFSRWIALLALTIAASVHAGTHGELREAYSKGDFVKAMDIARPLAATGDHRAQFVVGVMYAMGQGVKQDFKTAVTWFKFAADQGHAKAQYYLGLAHANGEGVVRNEREAVVWHTRSAQQGDRDAQLALGRMYWRGDGGLVKDDVKAFDLILKSAQQGLSAAQALVGLMYASGEGVPKDRSKAYFWYLLASVEGDDSVRSLRDEIGTLLTPAQRATVQAQASSWKPK